MRLIHRLASVAAAVLLGACAADVGATGSAQSTTVAVAPHTVLTSSPVWAHSHRASASRPVSLRVALHHGDSSRLLSTFDRVFDPAHAEYLNYPHANELRQMMQPTERVLTAVRDWLENEVCDASRRPTCTVEWTTFNDGATIAMSAEEMESFIGTELHVYKRVGSVGTEQRETVRTSVDSLEHLIPSHLRQHISHLTGLTRFPQELRAHAAMHGSEKLELIAGIGATASAAASKTATVDAAEADRRRAQFEANAADMASIKSEVPDGSPVLTTIGLITTSDHSIFISQMVLFCSTNPLSLAYSADGSLNWCTDSNGGIYNFKAIYVDLFDLNGALESSNKVPTSALAYGTVGFQTVPLIYQYTLPTRTNYAGYKVQFRIVCEKDFTSTGVWPFLFSGSETNTPQRLKSKVRLPDSLAGQSVMTSVGIGAIALSADSAGFYSPADLTAFFAQNGLASPVAAEWQDFYKYPSSNYPSQADGETSLDIQYAMGLLNRPTPGSTSGKIYHVGSRWATPDASIFDNAIEAVFTDVQKNGARPPTVFSLSYIGPEQEDTAAPAAEYRYTNTRFAALGLLGVSVFVSSGDDGAFWARTDGYHKQPDLQSTCARFTPLFPATSPYVTAVGATQLKSHAMGVCPRPVQASLETGAIITGGGGFSNLFDQPAWQRAAVANWTGTPQCPKPSLYFNRTRRAIPDISLPGHSFPIVYKGQSVNVDGTSASAPAAAGMFALIMDLRTRSGLKPLGFLNPLLYSAWAANASTFTDVTEGTNRCLKGGSVGCCTDGYQACVGYDPVTGLGEPNFAALAPFLGVKLDGPVTDMLDCSVRPPAPANTKNHLPLILGLSISGGLLFIIIAFCCFRRHQQRKRALANTSLDYAVLAGGQPTGYAAPMYRPGQIPGQPYPAQGHPIQHF